MNVSPPPANPNSRFRVWTNRRTVDSATTTSGISRRSRTQIRCAVWRCFRGAFRSDCRISSMYPVAGPSFGFSRGAAFRSGGTALAIASRTIRRCTPNFRATPFIVPTPCSYSRRICSNNSTFCLLFNWPPFPTRPGPKQNIRIYVLNRGPNPSIKVGRSRVAKSTQASTEVGHRFLVSAHETFSLLSTQPDMGWNPKLRLRELHGLRLFRVAGFEKILILYRPLENGVEILRVIHGSQNVRRLLRRQGIE